MKLAVKVKSMTHRPAADCAPCRRRREGRLLSLKKIGKGFVENERKAVLNSLKHVWVVQMDK